MSPRPVLAASQDAYAEKAGFVREGVARNAGYVHDGRVDLVLFSLVPDDIRASGAGSNAHTPPM